jgi:hypothetical protein
MKQIFLLVFVCILCPSCVSTKEYAPIVNSKTERLNHSKRPSRDWVVVSALKTEPRENTYIQQKKSFVPALFYWGWNSVIDCELDMETRTEYLRQGIYKAADKLLLKQYLADNTLHIKLKEVPGKFRYMKYGDLLILGFYVSWSNYDGISPSPISLEYEYTFVSKDGNVEAKGEGRVKNEEQSLKNETKSLERLTWSYMDNIQKEADRMSVELVSGIIAKIKKGK